jgi:F-type H+-transporting ATPase subunit b
VDALGIDFRFILTQALGFLILVFVLSKFAFGPILNLLQRRQDTIRGNLDEAQSRRDEMVQLQRDYEERLAKIEDEARDKIQAAVKEAQIARDEIMQRAQTESEAIVQRGHADIERQRQQAMVEMRNELSDLAIQAARRVIKGNLDATNSARLIDEVIAGAGQNSSTRNGQATSGSAA